MWDYDTSKCIVYVWVCEAQAKSVVLPLYPLKMPFNVGAAFLCLVVFVYVLRFRYTNNTESDKCKLNTYELGRMKIERENKMPKKGKKSMDIAIGFGLHIRKR